MNCSKFYVFFLEYEILWWQYCMFAFYFSFFYFVWFVPYLMIVYAAASYHTKLLLSTQKKLSNHFLMSLFLCAEFCCLEDTHRKKARKFIFSKLSSQLNRRAYNLVTNIKLKIISIPSFFLLLYIQQHLNVIWWENKKLFSHGMKEGNWNVVLNRVTRFILALRVGT